jgi:hypothetical protein
MAFHDASFRTSLLCTVLTKAVTILPKFKRRGHRPHFNGNSVEEIAGMF